MSYYFKYMVAVIFIQGCEKARQPTNPHDQLKTITIVEKLTDIPVAGAKISLRRCDNWDVNVGCLSYTTTILTSNNLGQAETNEYDGIIIEHSNYWPRNLIDNSCQSNLTSLFTLTPKCTIKVVIRKINPYLENDKLEVVVKDENVGPMTPWLFPCIPFAYNSKTLNDTRDTIVYISGQGNSDNQISYTVFHSDNTIARASKILPLVYVNKFDTIDIAINY